MQSLFMDTMTLYMQEISRYPLLSEDEEIRLTREFRKGDSRAREQIICSNLRLLVKIAHRYHRRDVFDLQDLIQEGNIGLMKAVDHFDPQRGYRFSTYAAFWIKREILRSFENTFRPIRLPSRIHLKILEMKKLIQSEERSLSDIMLSKQLGIPEKEVKTLKDYALPVLSLNRFTEGDAGEEYEGMIVNTQVLDPEETILSQMRFDRLKDAVEMLEPREADVLQRHYGLWDTPSQTLKAIGDDLGLSKERIRQIESKAVGKLKELVY